MNPKAPATSPNDIRCGNCGNECVHVTADTARAHGWRISWTPGEPSWCPDCWGGEKRQRVTATQPYDEPLF